jgi:fucose 4-O-acetylase-like acetyltransferase
VEEKTNNHRLVFIDVLKLFAIFCVIWGHTSGISHNLDIPNYVGMFTYSFHMPLFYFLSGIFLFIFNKILYQNCA